MKKILPLLLAIGKSILILFLFIFGQGLAQLVTLIPFPDQLGFLEIILVDAASLGFGILLLYLFVKWADKKDFSFLGLTLKGHGVEFLMGCALGALLIFAGFFILLLTGSIQVTIIPIQIKHLITFIFTFFFLATLEEVYFRGYILNKLMTVSNKYVALGISALIFSAVHTFNPGFTFLSFVNIFLAGILLGLLYLRTRNLWLASGFHFLWNLTQGLLGFNVSGTESPSFFEIIFKEKNLFNGGDFGFEGSLVCTLLLALISGYLLVKDYQNNSQTT